MKQEFSKLIKSIFENPEILKTLVNEKKLSNDQSKIVLKIIDQFDLKSCVCCRRFDITKLQHPINKELDAILDIAQANVKTRNY